jgi:hypothetical protein
MVPKNRTGIDSKPHKNKRQSSPLPFLAEHRYLNHLILPINWSSRPRLQPE